MMRLQDDAALCHVRGGIPARVVPGTAWLKDLGASAATAASTAAADVAAASSSDIHACGDCPFRGNFNRLLYLYMRY